MSPWQQLVNSIDFMICDTAEDMGEPSLWFDAVDFGRFNQGKGDCHGLASTLRTGKHPVFPARGHRFDCALTSVVIEFQNTIVEIGPRF